MPLRSLNHTAQSLNLRTFRRSVSFSVAVWRALWHFNNFRRSARRLQLLYGGLAEFVSPDGELFRYVSVSQDFQTVPDVAQDAGCDQAVARHFRTRIKTVELADVDDRVE